MRQQNHKGPKLPHQLLEQIGGSALSGRSGRGRNAAAGRKERRRGEREQKKTQRKQPRLNRTHVHRKESPGSDATEDLEEASPPQVKPSRSRPITIENPVKSISKQPMQDAAPPSKKATRSPSPQRISRGVKDKLAEDDAEIAALEKRLGLKGKKKKLPKSFEEDGLDVLLDGLDDGLVDDRKRKRNEDEAWLESKRRKRGARPVAKSGEDDGQEGSEDGMSDILNGEEGGDEDDDEDVDQEDSSGDEDSQHYDAEDTGSTTDADDGEEGDKFEGFESDVSEDVEQPRVRENPYVAPVSANAPPSTRYVPPSLRGPSTSDTESLSRLRRQIQGLLNRLSEANLVTILRDIEQLYQSNPRQYVTSTLIDLLLGLICDRTSLMDTFIILHAGFIAAVYKVIGADFGAQAVERIVTDFDKHYQNQQPLEAGGKETTNLMSLVSELYNFQVIGSNLVFDYIRLFLETMSEENTELLLRIIKNSGPQLRQDDPTALRDIVVLLQKSIVKAGEASLSVRTKFMIETINSLKNNRMKTGVAASSVVSEHTIRMKKTLGSLNARNLKASEPLRIGLNDIRDTEKKGKWWLVGASWRNNMADGRDQNDLSLSKPKSASRRNETMDSGTSDLLQLAKEQRMNTDIRRAIFITIMSATDYKDAHLRLLKLRLKRAQEPEMPRVLIHCAGSEQSYNPYYTLIARRLCSDHKLKMAFQFSLWDLFKRMGERSGEDDLDLEDEEEEGAAMNTRKIVNLAKMFGTLIADGGLPITVLKTLNFAYLQPKTRTFAEVLLITIMLQTQKRAPKGRDESALLDVIVKMNDAPQIAGGLRHFLKNVVGKSDLAGSNSDKDTVRWGCRVTADALTTLSSVNLGGV